MQPRGRHHRSGTEGTPEQERIPAGRSTTQGAGRECRGGISAAGLPAWAVLRREGAGCATPLGVDGSKPLGSVVFGMPLGDEYALNALGSTRRRSRMPRSKNEADSRVQEGRQPRFVAGDPPAVIAGVGAGHGSLVSTGSCCGTDLPRRRRGYRGATVADTPVPGTQEPPLVHGAQYGINFTSGIVRHLVQRPLMKRTAGLTRKRGRGYDAERETAHGARGGVDYPASTPVLRHAVLAAGVEGAGEEPISPSTNSSPMRGDTNPSGRRAGELAQMRERALHGGIEGLSHTEAQ